MFLFLQHCIDKVSVPETEMVHAHVIKTGTHEEFFVMSFLVNVYAKCGVMVNARKVFDNLPRRNVVVWTTLMTGYVQNSQPEVAVEVFGDMLESGSFPSNFTLSIALNACSSLESITLGKQFHAFIIKYRISHDSSIGNALCSLYSKFGSLDSSVKAFSTIQSSDLGMQVHSLSIKLGHESNLRITNSLVYLYLKCGCIDEAKNLFNRMEYKNLITWNAMIAGHAQAMDLAKDNFSAQQTGTEALGMYLKLNRSGRKPDLFTLSSILTVCSRLAALEQGNKYMPRLLNQGFYQM
uniref:Pentatricopeptide repeat-containing protein n=1 Tax=Populus alba TaxID=43335 RepID=A0A4U5PN37_POPAL|nr:pentatricopeptide repeat-containing protein [Populus alba]